MQLSYSKEHPSSLMEHIVELPEDERGDSRWYANELELLLRYPSKSLGLYLCDS